ncbi:MAG TPA: hypothetical protein VFO85_08530 [Vicinamibacteria bacterium]|nr:hypothetical protein [Vicinamibacteria bacterium]
MGERLERMRRAVAELYERNRQRGVAPWCGRPYDFVCPSTGTYPFQWFWDSCFHAVALSHVDPARSRSELRSLLANQQPDGFVAHVTFWQREKFEALLSTYSIAYRTPYLSDCMQPPVLAEAAQAAARGPGGDEFLREVLPAVRAYFDWLQAARDPDGDGLVATLQPDESGLDHTPKYDAYLGIREVRHQEYVDAWQRVAGPYDTVGRATARMFELDVFVVEDVLVNTIYAENQRVLAGLLERTGDAAGAAHMRARSARTLAGLLEKCWDAEAGLFFDAAGGAEEKLRVNTVSSLLPLALPDLPAEVAERLIAHLSDPREYWARYPVPSVAMNEPSFVAGVCGDKLVFRGPTWMNTNWYLTRGLRHHGRTDLARTVEERSAELVERSGFREYYDPHTGEGHGARDFSWTALVLDMLERHEADR